MDFTKEVQQLSDLIEDMKKKFEAHKEDVRKKLQQQEDCLAAMIDFIKETKQAENQVLDSLRADYNQLYIKAERVFNAYLDE